MSLSKPQIDASIEALTNNAKNLIFEAGVLFEVKAFARAFTLAHLAREELAKCGILHSVGTRLLAKIPVDWKKTIKRLRVHESKLQYDVLNMAMRIQAKDNVLGEDVSKRIGSIVSHRNALKNNSLYVGFEGGKITSPEQIISERQAFRTIELAKYALEEQIKVSSFVGRFSERDEFDGKTIIEGLSALASLNTSEAIKDLAPIYQAVMDIIDSSSAQKNEPKVNN